jgi:ABC-type sulfate transport system substrate-binding protein
VDFEDLYRTTYPRVLAYARSMASREDADDAVAEAYLAFLASPEGQRIAVKHFYRPRQAAAAPAGKFPAVKLFTIDERFGGWTKAQAAHFDSGGVFDKISVKGGGGAGSR